MFALGEVRKRTLPQGQGEALSLAGYVGSGVGRAGVGEAVS